MNQNNFYIILIAVVFVFWMFIRRQSQSGGNRISPADAKTRLDSENGIILLDVRTKGEYLERHIPKSTLIPLDILENEASRKLPDKDAAIFVYCRTGSRSSVAAKILTKSGYTNVFNLGGILRWPYETVSGKK